jgi:hypothetical protein
MPSALAAPLKLRQSPTRKACTTEIKLMAGDIGVGLDDNLLGAGLREAAAPRFAEESWQCADAMRTWADAEPQRVSTGGPF